MKEGAELLTGCGPQATMVELSEQWEFWFVQTAGGSGGGGGGGGGLLLLILV